ncbi:MAG TPA: M48 family metallopeptidase [Pyrinomonadaceae bacterium]|jgi:Zn-dependent protease with chaperone function|nr:M48 family metallopeptidase [Pyrinomonadaceae bacterium]
MIRKAMFKRQTLIAWIALIAITVMPFSALAQTQIKYHGNKYSVQDDIKLGRQAAQEAETQFPLLRDETVRSYVENVGRRLVAGIPSEFQHPEFQYYFKVVNARDINAFALPGGPMYVNRGMIEAARSEGEMAGVMAHEISHVALRHGTAQATKGQKYSILGGIAGIAGTILGGPGVGQLAQAPFAVYLLKFSREYETEADILGAQIMAQAGYDPRELANMFRTIEQQGGGGGGFLSDHPSPSDRYARINREAQSLRINNSGYNDSRDFARIQERLRGYQRAPTMAEIARSGQRYPVGEQTGNYPSNPPSGRVSYPSTRYQSYNIFNGGVQVSVPSNWRQVNDSNSVWFVPDGAYGQYNGQAVYTHGASFGVAQTNNRNLQSATQEFINNLAQGNNSLRTSGGYQRTTLSGRTALFTTLSNVNEATGRPENVRIITTQLRNGQLFYMIAVAPQNERNFENAFQTILQSVRIND